MAKNYNGEEEYQDFIESGYGDGYSELFQLNSKVEKRCKSFFIKNKMTIQDIISDTPKGKKFNNLVDELYKNTVYKEDTYFPY